MSFLLIAVVNLTILRVFSEPLWIETELQEFSWLETCDLIATCIKPTLQLHLFDTSEKEAISKILPLTFDDRNITGIHLLSYWNIGMSDSIALIITVNGIDPDYNFPRICDSTSTIFPFKYEENITQAIFSSLLDS
ncbi:unnamed protein product [Thelazia callipaeda]|uniref:Secreted protein n=1 Tax=Thelazia callipaeda TaxID=103827 RepID=A0A0N5CSR6_THECL|nr:unnamed protein product [Thelazia callipaeda]